MTTVFERGIKATIFLQFVATYGSRRRKNCEKQSSEMLFVHRVCARERVSTQFVCEKKKIVIWA